MAVRRHTIPTIPYQPNPAAGDAFASNINLRQRNVADEEASNAHVQETFGDPMHALAINNAQQNLLGARTDVSGMGAVLQGIHEAAAMRGKQPRVGFKDDTGEAPSAQSPASWNPAGMTESGAMADVQKYLKGGAAPSYAMTGTPDTQDAFRRRVLQGIKGAKV